MTRKQAWSRAVQKSGAWVLGVLEVLGVLGVGARGAETPPSPRAGATTNSRAKVCSRVAEAWAPPAWPPIPSATRNSGGVARKES